MLRIKKDILIISSKDFFDKVNGKKCNYVPIVFIIYCAYK
jgi:hypothetical protein